MIVGDQYARRTFGMLRVHLDRYQSISPSDPYDLYLSCIPAAILGDSRSSARPVRHVSPSQEFGMNSAVATSDRRSPLANDLSAILPANAAFLAQPRKLLIDGAWVAAVSGKTFEVRDPSSDQVIAHCALGDAADVDLAVAAARRAFESGDWSRMKPVDRERLLHRLADLIEQHADELAELEAIDNGKSVVMARHVDIKHALEVWRYMAGWPTKIEG